MAYETDSGNIIWANRLVKEYLRMPYLKNVHHIKETDAHLFAEIIALPERERKVVTSVRPESELKWLLTANTFSFKETNFKLITVQDIKEALDITETEAWKKMLRILTHEIMNSIAPISSVADTLQSELEKIPSAESLTASTFQDLKEGMATIKSRSNGLLRFSESYRNLNRVDSIHLSVFYVYDLFESLFTLMNPTLEQKDITLDIILKNPSLQIKADRELLEQLLLNLLLNAIDAVKDKSQKEIAFIGEVGDNYKPVLKVKDNGCGMDGEIMKRIFIPFFSTKKTGSGIGLSLCKQIMLLHRGSIRVQSAVGEGTVFSLHF